MKHKLSCLIYVGCNCEGKNEMSNLKYELEQLVKKMNSGSMAIEEAVKELVTILLRFA